MSRLVHGAAALALIAIAAFCLLGLTGAGAESRAGDGSAAAGSSCQTVVCMFAIS